MADRRAALRVRRVVDAGAPLTPICRSCGASIRWALLSARWVPFEAEPVATGEYALSTAMGGAIARRVAAVAPALVAGLDRHDRHRCRSEAA